MSNSNILRAPGNNDYSAGGGNANSIAGGAGAEPGAVDNRLSLDPSDKRFKAVIGDWTDGEEYDITVHVRQISPGEYEVTDVKPSAAEAPADDETDTTGDDDAGGDDDSSPPSKNPELAGLME